MKRRKNCGWAYPTSALFNTWHSVSNFLIIIIIIIIVILIFLIAILLTCDEKKGEENRRDAKTAVEQEHHLDDDYHGDDDDQTHDILYKERVLIASQRFIHLAHCHIIGRVGTMWAESLIIG